MKLLIVGAGVTGCFTAARLLEKGVDVSLLARGDKAARLERDGLSLLDGVTGEETQTRLNIVRAPVTETFDVVMVCVQGQQRPSLVPLLEDLPGSPVTWYLGNTTVGYDNAVEQFGTDRVLGGFPGVGGMWDGDTLVFADREQADHKPLDRLIIGEAHPDAAPAAENVQRYLKAKGMNVERYVPVMDWHLCHVAFVLPLAGAVYQHNQDLAAVAADRALMKQTMRATAQGLTALKHKGHKILPKNLNLLRWLPAALGARKISTILSSDFGRIAIAGHAATARGEMRGFAADLLALAGPDAGPDFHSVLSAI